MRFKKHFILFLLPILLSACGNVSQIRKDHLVAYGQHLTNDRDYLYYLINIPVSAETQSSRVMSAQIKLSSDAPLYAIADLTPEIVSQYLPPFEPPKEWPEYVRQKALEEDAYAGGGFHIKFKDGSLSYVGICSHCAGGRAAPVVATPDGKSLFTLPLTEQQFIEVFGSLDRKLKVNEVYY